MKVLSGGNFHGAPVAYAADLLSIVLADLSSISERRTEKLINPEYQSGIACVSRPKRGTRIGVDDGAGDFRRAGVTDESSLPSCFSRLDRDIGGIGGPCQHVDTCLGEGGRMRGAGCTRDRDRITGGARRHRVEETVAKWSTTGAENRSDPPANSCTVGRSDPRS